MKKNPYKGTQAENLYEMMQGGDLEGIANLLKEEK